MDRHSLCAKQISPITKRQTATVRGERQTLEIRNIKGGTSRESMKSKGSSEKLYGELRESGLLGTILFV